MPTKPEDVTVAWGKPRSQSDMAMERWWLAVYQDMVPSNDGSRLYFLYDQAVESDGTYQAIVIFDPNTKRFLRDIPLNISEGRVKYFYLLRPNELALFVQNEDYSGNCILWMFAVTLTPDGMAISGMRNVLQSLNVGADWIICQSLDTVMLISGPGLTVWRLTLDRGVMHSYVVPGANIKNYFDATVFGNVIYLFPSLPDETLDFTHVHTIDTEGRTPMRPFTVRPDPSNGFPAVRKQCALDVWQGQLFVIGGQLDDPNRGTFRYGDVWSLDLRTLQWKRYHLQLPLLIIEPRMHINEHTGSCFLWGDCDLQQSCYTNRRHFHTMRLFVGVPPLNEIIWSKLARRFPQMLNAPIQYLRDALRLPEKFLYRVQQHQSSGGGGGQPQYPGAGGPAYTPPYAGGGGPQQPYGGQPPNPPYGQNPPPYGGQPAPPGNQGPSYGQGPPYGGGPPPSYGGAGHSQGKKKKSCAVM